MPSETYRVVLSVEIERPALEVYEFLASPVNHIGLHPSTAGISGEDTGAVYGVGDIWREHIARPAGETAEADWIVTRAVPGEHWTFQSVRWPPVTPTSPTSREPHLARRARTHGSFPT